MKFTILSLILLAACSSTPDKPKNASANVKKESFKKVKPLSANEVSDFYQGNASSINPALQDETLDRFTLEELSSLNASADPLMEISILCSKKNFNGAFAVASKHFDLYKKIAPYWNQIANCHLNQGSFRKALLFYNKAIEVNPDFVPALNNIGVMYSRQGLYQKALVAFERANKKSKFSKTPRYNLAKLYLTYGLAESALPIFQSLLNENGQDVDLLNAVASSYFLMSDYNRALTYYQRIPKDHWKNAEIGLNLSFTLKKLSQSQEATEVFQQIEQPKSANLKRYYASIGTKLGDGE
jgi:tetratricopeptide (TPR) repeat protein